MNESHRISFKEKLHHYRNYVFVLSYLKDSLNYMLHIITKHNNRKANKSKYLFSELI